MPFKRCYLLFVYFLLYKELRYILTSAVLKEVAKKRVPVLKKNPRNENDQLFNWRWKRFLRLFREQTPKRKRKRKSISSVASFACFPANRVVILCKSDFKMQMHAHYLPDSIFLLKMWMEFLNTVAVSCCGYCSVSWFLCITGKMAVKFII